MFDEASSWWLPATAVLPSQEDLDDNHQPKLSTKDDKQEIEVDMPSEESQTPQDKPANPWKSGVHVTPEEARPSQLEVDEPPQLQRSTRARKPNSRYVNTSLAETDDVLEPSSYEEACQNREWQMAMNEEISALKANQTWDLVPKPEEVKPISCRWVYKLKTRADGSIERYKARLVARWFSQQYEINYDETFSPVVKMTTVRILITLAANNSWSL